MHIQTEGEYKYAYETHLHTAEGSACGKSTGAEMAIACKEAGYTGIIVTDHFYHGNTRPDRSLPWRDWVEEYCKGYESAKEMGDKIGLQVFFAWETSYYDGTDFLCYGLDKQWLIDHPEIKDVDVPGQYKLLHEAGATVFHAHPFRKSWNLPQIHLFPECVDGVEIINTSHKIKFGPDCDYDEKAIVYAKEYDFPVSGGSDIHSVNLSGGGMIFPRRIEDIGDFQKALMERSGKVLYGGKIAEWN